MASKPGDTSTQKVSDGAQKNGNNNTFNNAQDNTVQSTDINPWNETLNMTVIEKSWSC